MKISAVEIVEKAPRWMQNFVNIAVPGLKANLDGWLV
jgi:hypothetical protein